MCHVTTAENKMQRENIKNNKEKKNFQRATIRLNNAAQQWKPEIMR